MIIPDINMLIYAYDSTSPDHVKAKKWWEGALSGREPIGLPWVVLLGFTRLISHPTICTNPLSVDEIRGVVNQWMKGHHVRLLSPSNESCDRFFDLLSAARMGGNLSTDALIAVHAMENSATVYSNDRDFGRFPGLKWKNPLKEGARETT